MNSSLVTRPSSLPCGAPRRNAGFTLIELLSVMGVMILITTIVVTSGFGLRRSATYSSVVSIPTSVMEYARQRACMDGRKTAVLFAPNGAEGTDNDEMAARIFQAAGIVSQTFNNNRIRDVFSDIAAFKTGFNMLTVFNFDNGKTFVVGEISKEGGKKATDPNVSFTDDATSDGEPNMYYYPYIEIIRSEADKSSPSISGNWKTGDAYGFEIADRQILPKNFSYTMKSGGHSGSNDSFWFIFNPDGTTDKSGSAAITVRESVGNKKFKQDISFN